jgi:hypothetical protein
VLNQVQEHQQHQHQQQQQQQQQHEQEDQPEQQQEDGDWEDGEWEEEAGWEGESDGGVAGSKDWEPSVGAAARRSSMKQGKKRSRHGPARLSGA